VIFEAQMQPFYGTVDGMVPINGSMRLVAGPQNPVTLIGYRIEYARDKDIASSLRFLTRFISLVEFDGLHALSGN
jgi:hypothetical protein